jgi:hypothetical protein
MLLRPGAVNGLIDFEDLELKRVLFDNQQRFRFKMTGDQRDGKNMPAMRQVGG